MVLENVSSLVKKKKKEKTHIEKSSLFFSWTFSDMNAIKEFDASTL